MQESADFPTFDPEDTLMRLPSGDWPDPRDITKITVETDPARFASFGKPFRPFVRINLGDNYVHVVQSDSNEYVRSFADWLGATVNQAKRWKPPAQDPVQAPAPAAPPAPPAPQPLKARPLNSRPDGDPPVAKGSLSGGLRDMSKGE